MTQRPTDVFQPEIEPYLDLAPEDHAPDGAYAVEALLIRALVQEVHTACLLTAGAASAVGIARSPAAPRALGEALQMVADFHAGLDHWPRQILEEQLSPATIEEVAGFYAAFRHARTRLIAFDAEARQIGLDRAATLHLSPLSTAWRLAARHGRAATVHLKNDSRHMLPDTYLENADIIDASLSRIGEGVATCCRRDGSIVLPQLAERRSAPRRSLLQTAVVRTGSCEFTAFARDVSIGGLGLTRMPAIAVGTPLVVELSSGRVLRGRVAWSEGTDTGISFDRPLQPTDSLIFG